VKQGPSKLDLEREPRIRALVAQRLTAEEIGRRMGLSRSGVSASAHRLGIKLTGPRGGYRHQRAWTDEELEILRQHAGKTLPEDIHKLLPGRTLQAVYKTAALNNLSLDCPAGRERKNQRMHERVLAAKYGQPGDWLFIPQPGATPDYSRENVREKPTGRPPMRAPSYVETACSMGWDNFAWRI